MAVKLASGDHQRASEKPGIFRRKDEKNKKKFYNFILQIIPLVIGFVLRQSIHFLKFTSEKLEKIICKSFDEISPDFQALMSGEKNFNQFTKNFKIEKTFCLILLFILCPLFFVTKILYFINKFLLSEVPFE